MSYARFGEDGSDVYILAMEVYDENNIWTGIMQLCCYTDSKRTFCTTSGEKMLEHIETLKSEGMNVPDYAKERIQDEMKDYGCWVYPYRKWHQKRYILSKYSGGELNDQI